MINHFISSFRMAILPPPFPPITESDYDYPDSYTDDEDETGDSGFGSGTAQVKEWIKLSKPIYGEYLYSLQGSI